MAFPVVAWANGHYLTAVKLTHMLTRDEHCRDLASYKDIASVGGPVQTDNNANSPLHPSFKLSIDGSDIGSGVNQAGTRTETNIAIDGYSVGIHVLKVTVWLSTYNAIREFWFYRSDDMNYLSYRVILAAYGGGYGHWGAEFHSLKVIGHRVSESW